MRERKRVAINTIVAHEQPTREALIDMRAPIGQGGLGSLRYEGMDKMQQQAAEALTLPDHMQERGGFNPVTRPRQLDVLIMRALVRTEQKRKPAHAFTTIDADLDAHGIRP